MKRRRSSAPGRLRPDGRWSQSILPAVLVMVLGACGSSTATNEPSPSSAPAPTGDATTAPVTETPTEEPTATAATRSPESSATPPATATAAPTSSTDPGSARACSGSDENRDFYASMAAAVEWTVYCPVLPDGWFVGDGQYRLAGGGWMEITYEGPGDAGITLRQGAFCAGSDGCVPTGREVGTTEFGDRTGTLVAGDDGSWAVVVDRGATPSWLLVATGIDEASARAIAEQLLAVAG